MKRKHAQPNVESMKDNPKNHQFTENGLEYGAGTAAVA